MSVLGIGVIVDFGFIRLYGCAFLHRVLNWALLGRVAIIFSSFAEYALLGSVLSAVFAHLLEHLLPFGQVT